MDDTATREELDFLEKWASHDEVADRGKYTPEDRFRIREITLKALTELNSLRAHDWEE